MKIRLNAVFAVAVAICLILSGCAGHGPVITAPDTGPIKVACVGDSITAGSGTKNRFTDSYPAQLGNMLGDGWHVRNFGVGGATMLRQGDKPHWHLDAFKKATAFQPDVVIIKLGTNDSKPRNWRFGHEFFVDYADMISHFKALSTDPAVWICCPVPAYENRFTISGTVVREEIIPGLKKLAKQKRVGVIDLWTPISRMPEVLEDGVHPNETGAEAIAKEIYKTVTSAPVTQNR